MAAIDPYLKKTTSTTKDPYLSNVVENSSYKPTGNITRDQAQLNEKLSPYGLDVGTLYRQLDINATGPYAEKNRYIADIAGYIQGTLLQTAAEGKVLEYEDKVRDAILIASFTGRDVQNDVLPNFEMYAKQFTGVDTKKSVAGSFADYFKSLALQKQANNLTLLLLDVPYGDPRRDNYEAMLNQARTDFATTTADVSTKSQFWRKIASSGLIAAQTVEQLMRTFAVQALVGGIGGAVTSALSPAVTGIEQMGNALLVGDAMRYASTASAVQYTASTMMQAEAAEIASAAMEMVDENGNRIPLDVIKDYAYDWGLISAFTEMSDDLITPIGRFQIGEKTVGEVYNGIKDMLKKNPLGYAGLFAAGTTVQASQEGLQGSIRQHGLNQLIRRSNELGYTNFGEDAIKNNLSDYWSTALDEFKESFLPMAASQALTGGLAAGAVFATGRLSEKMSVTPQMKKDANKYFTDSQGRVYDLGYVDTVGAEPVDLYAPKEKAKDQTQKKAAPIMMTVNKQTGALVPVYKRDRQYAEYLRSQGVTGIRGIVISDDFVSKVGNTASAQNLGSILGMRMGEDNPVMGYDGDTVIMETPEGVEAAAADIESLKNELFWNPEAVSLEKQEDGSYRLMWESESGRERSVLIRAKNDTDEMRATTGEGEQAQTTGNVNPIRTMETQGLENMFTSAARKSREQTLEDAEVEYAAKYFYSQLTGMTMDEVEDAWKNDYSAIMEKLPAGVGEATIEQGARFMPILSAVTGRSTEDLLNDQQRRIVLKYNGKAKVASYRTGQTGLVEGGFNASYDEDSKTWTYNINLTDAAGGRSIALVHELMHVARELASPEKLSGFAGLKGYTSYGGAMWRSDIRETDDGRYQLGDRTYDTLEEAQGMVETNEEQFVRDFLEYLRTGESPNAEVASFFGALKQFLQRFVDAFSDRLSQETKAAFDKLLSGEVTVNPGQTIEEAVAASDATLSDEMPQWEANDYSDEEVESYINPEGEMLYSIDENYDPKKTGHGYKLFEQDIRTGELYPLFIGKNEPTKTGVWNIAENIPTKGFSNRPGWHIGSTYPLAVWLLGREGQYNSQRGKNFKRVWCEVSYPMDVDYQSELDERGIKDIKDHTPENGYYRFREANGEWIIAGALRIDKVLSDADVKAVLDSQGIDYNTMVREQIRKHFKTELPGDYSLYSLVEDPAKKNFQNISEVKKWAENARTVKYEGVSIVGGIKDLENLPLRKEVEMAKALNEITGNDVILLPRRMMITETAEEGLKSSKSPDGINAISKGRTVEFRRTAGSKRTIKDFIVDAVSKSDDAFIVITALKKDDTVENIMNSVKGSLRNNALFEGNHVAVIADVRNSDIRVYEIKKETSGEVSASGRGLNEYRPRSRTAYLYDTLLPQIVKAEDISRIDLETYRNQDLNSQQGSGLNSILEDRQWQTMDANTQRRIDADYDYVRNQYFGTDKWMKAPNGQPTKLTERQWVQVRTPAFKEWFGDWENDPENSSKVLDDNGEPLAVYHGSNEDTRFSVFKEASHGIFFSDNKAVAEEISRENYGTQMYEVFLNSRNPLVLDAKGNEWTQVLTDEEAAQLGLTEYARPADKAFSEEPGFYSANDIARVAKRMNYDGVILKNVMERYWIPASEDYIVFKSNQIKSATDNDGSFGRNTANILFSIAPSVDSQEFKDWYDGSVLVDEEGKPIVLYHGSPVSGIEEFNPQNAAHGGEGLIYASDVRDVAEGFAFETTEGPSVFRRRLTGNKGQVYPIYMVLKNPLDMRNLSEHDKEILLNAYREFWKPSDAEETFNEVLEAGNHQFLKVMARTVIENLSGYGYDGLIAQMGTNLDVKMTGINHIEYAAVSPQQVKQVASRDLYSLVYHGTAASFDRFELGDKAGSGEGGQAFGYGVYVTEGAGIGKAYAKADQKRKGGILLDSKFAKERKEFLETSLKEYKHMLALIEEMNPEWGSKQDESVGELINRERMAGNITQNAWKYLAYFPRLTDMAKALRNDITMMSEELSDLDAKAGAKRNLYKVEIPDWDDGTHVYNQWDEKVNVAEVRRLLDALEDEGVPGANEIYSDEEIASWKGEDLYNYLANTLKHVEEYILEDKADEEGWSDSKLNMAINDINGYKLASEFLSKQGYTGNRYEAERRIRRPGEKARYYNYVIFDPADTQIVNHWTYSTDEEGAPLHSLSPARQAEVLQSRKTEIENAVNAGIFVSTEYLNEFRGEAWADAELELRDWMAANPDVVSMARSSDSLEEFRKRFFKKNSKQEKQEELDFDDIPFDEPEGYEEEIFGSETAPEETEETENTLSDAWLEKIYSYAHAQSSQDRDRQFAAEWTSSEDKTLELAKALRGYMDAVSSPRKRKGGYWTTRYIYNSYKGVSNKVRMLSDGKGRGSNRRERSSSEEIQEAQKLIRENPRPYRNAYQLAMMGESRAAEVKAGEFVGMAAEYMRLEAVDDDIAQEIERLEAEEERARRLKTDYKAKYEDIRQKLHDAEKDLAKYQESAKSKISDLSDFLMLARRKIDELNTQIKENEADMKSAETAYSRLIEKLGGRIENLQDQNAELRGYRQQARQMEKQLQDRRARVEELREQLTDAHKEERRLNNALNALRRWKEAKDAADYRKKRIRQIQRLANFNPGSVDASFEESLMWIANLFERDEEAMEQRKSLTERIAELKEQIDAARSRGEDVAQMQQNLLQLRKQKKESRKLTPPAQLAIYLPADYLVRADNRQSAWTAEELDVLLAAVRKMRADAKQMLEMKQNTRMSRLMGFAYGYFQQMVGRPADTNIEGEMSSYALGRDIAENLPEGEQAKGLSSFRLWNAKLQRLARILDNNKEGLLYDWFVRDNYRHQSEELEGIRRRLEAGEAKWKELGLRGKDLSKEGFQGTKQNGTEYSLTRGQMLGVYIYAKSELGMEKLTHYNGNNLSEEDVNAIIKGLTPQETAWADFMMEDMQSNYGRLRDVYYRGWNMNLGQRENYFTLVPSDAATESQLENGIDPQGDMVGKDNKVYTNKDFTKNVNPNAVYPLDLDVTRTWNYQVRKQEHFIAYGEWAKDSQYLFDHKGGQIYNVMERTIGKTQARNFKKIVDNVIGGQMSDNDFDKSYTKWLARRNSAVLIGNTGTMLKQGPSWFAAFNGDVKISDAMKNAVAINATFRNFLTEHPDIASEFSDVDKAYDFIWANAPEMKDRQIDMDIMEQLSRMDGNKFSYLFNPANRAISKWTMGLVDKLVVNNLWMSRYYTVFKQQKEEGKTDMQAHEEAAFKASQFISETQPTSMRMDQSSSQIDAKGSAFLRSVMVFTNQVVNTFNQLYLDVPMAIRQRNWKKAVSTIASSMFMVGLAAVLSGKFVKRGNEDGEKYVWRLIRELLATGMAASAPGFGSIVAAGLEYDSDYSTYIFGIDAIGSSLKKILTPSDSKTALERMGSALEDIAAEAGYAVGAPVTPAKNIVKSIKNGNPAYLLNGAWGQIIESYR